MKGMKPMKYNDVFDDALDERGFLKDGHRIRVPMTFMDAMQRAVAMHDARQDFADGKLVICDRNGNSDAASLAQPGPRFLKQRTAADNKNLMGDQARADARGMDQGHCQCMASRRRASCRRLSALSRRRLGLHDQRPPRQVGTQGRLAGLRGGGFAAKRRGDDGARRL
jgi:hypothetical protein